jgi:major membrane immunogen (membrane-anchored lipoprotein)
MVVWTRSRNSNMEKQLLENQNIVKVDSTSGATYSLYRFRCVIILALMKAKLENSIDPG